MRKIEFRGRRANENKWLYGDLVHRNGKTHIFPVDGMNSAEYYEVDPGTVGQFTGLHDGRRGQGQEIYPGDIVKEEDRGFIYICKWNRHRCEFAWFLKDGSYIGSIGDMRIGLKVIGNIHDNPELMQP